MGEPQDKRKKPEREEPRYDRFYAEDGSMEISKAGPLTDEDRAELAAMLNLLGVPGEGKEGQASKEAKKGKKGR